MAHEEKILQEELRVFEQHRLEWLPSHCGEFVAIVGAKIIGFYPDFESAFKAGLPIAGPRNSFLVKQIWAEDPIYVVFSCLAPQVRWAQR